MTTKMAPEAETAVYKKVFWRIVPFLFLCYAVSIFWSLPTAFLSGTAAAAGIVFTGALALMMQRRKSVPRPADVRAGPGL
jgi:hypothetical protein